LAFLVAAGCFSAEFVGCFHLHSLCLWFIVWEPVPRKGIGRTPIDRLLIELAEALLLTRDQGFCFCHRCGLCSRCLFFGDCFHTISCHPLDSIKRGTGWQQAKKQRTLDNLSFLHLHSFVTIHNPVTVFFDLVDSVFCLKSKGIAHHG